ncbi:MAG: hypothetical protein IJT94_18380 [Oscillibacter sp.]|nr:hypothetical protein [Oscillibacter sp.]
MTELHNIKTDLSVPVTGAVKDPETGEAYPMASGVLFATIRDHTEYNYLSLDAMPKELLGADSPYTIQAVLVNGEPAVPVTADLTLTGGCAVSLKPEAYTRGQEINAKYQVAAKVQVGPVEYVLAQHPKTHFFATWERTPGNDKPEQPDYYWGHYREDRREAVKDFCTRASEKCAKLEQDRKPSILGQLAEKPVSGRDTSGRARQKAAAVL